VNAFLDHWAPDVALWAESEIWPNLILQTKARNIPMALINARISEKSFQGWNKRPKSAQALFGCFDITLAGDAATAQGLSSLLDKKVENMGSLKEAAPALPVNETQLSRLKKQIGKRPVWCAASTHKGEEEIILAAHEEVRAQHTDALLILALRHPERRSEVTPFLSTTPHNVRTNNHPITERTSVMVIDTIGEMGLAYSLSDITFVCGSLVEGLMGHNPLEPAQFSSAVLTGEHISSFADSYSSMIAFNAAERRQTVSNLFSNPEALARKKRLAFDYAKSRNTVLDVVWDKLSPVLPEASS